MQNWLWLWGLCHQLHLLCKINFCIYYWLQVQVPSMREQHPSKAASGWHGLQQRSASLEPLRWQKRTCGHDAKESLGYKLYIICLSSQISWTDQDCVRDLVVMIKEVWDTIVSFKSSARTDHKNRSRLCWRLIRLITRADQDCVGDWLWC